MNFAMQQKKIILQESQEYFLVKRTIQYDTGFETDLALVGNRYEIWYTKYREKFEKDIIEEFIDGEMVHYCKLYTAENDDEMLKSFAERIEQGTL